jgi:RecB family endonuclease NucS
MILDMAIVIRNQGGKWEKTEKVTFVDEAQLQKMLYESPELIPTKVEDQAAVFTREAGLPGSGFTDLVGVDAQGNILIVETKLARNSEIRRKVIGHVLEYVSYLWRISFDDLYHFFL